VETRQREGQLHGDQAAIETIREAIAKLRPAFRTSSGGDRAPALSNDEMTAAFHDSSISDVLAFALTLLVMTLAFMRVGKPLLMLGVLAVTSPCPWGWSPHGGTPHPLLRDVHLHRGRHRDDYGIYYLFRYEEEIFLVGTSRGLELARRAPAPGCWRGADRRGTFFVLMLTDFRGIQELGFIAASRS